MIPVVSLPVTVANVPFYSQFQDIASSHWQKQGCGVASLAMVIDFYKPAAVSVNKLLALAIASGAYDESAGWKHHDLVVLSKKYGLEGNNYDLSASSSAAAFAKFKSYLGDGPVIVSVYYKFDPKSTIPHLVVINGIDKGMVYYNDPASQGGEKQISTADFLKGWKKKFIVLRPVHTGQVATVQGASPSITANKYADQTLANPSLSGLLGSWMQGFFGGPFA